MNDTPVVDESVPPSVGPLAGQAPQPSDEKRVLSSTDRLPSRPYTEQVGGTLVTHN